VSPWASSVGPRRYLDEDKICKATVRVSSPPGYRPPPQNQPGIVRCVVQGSSQIGDSLCRAVSPACIVPVRSGAEFQSRSTWLHSNVACYLRSCRTVTANRPGLLNWPLLQERWRLACGCRQAQSEHRANMITKRFIGISDRQTHLRRLLSAVRPLIHATQALMEHRKPQKNLCTPPVQLLQ